MSPDPAIRITGLLHDYGLGPVLDIQELGIDPGMTHLTGPNGAGKTTLLTILATLTTPTRGQVTVRGHDLATHGAKLRAITGYLGHRPSLHPELTVQETLALHADLHGVPATAIDQAITRFDLDALTATRVARLSHGQARRADLARATLHDPAVLLLDEPTAGLDTAGLAHLDDVLAARTSEVTILASHSAPPTPPDHEVHLEDGKLTEAPHP